MNIVISTIAVALFVSLLVRAIRRRPPRSKATFLGDRIVIERPDLIVDACDDGKEADDMEFEEFEATLTDQSLSSDVTIFYHEIKHWTVKSWSANDENGVVVKIYVTTNRKQTYSLDFSRQATQSLRQYVPDKEKVTKISKITTGPWRLIIYIFIALSFLYTVYQAIYPILHF